MYTSLSFLPFEVLTSTKMNQAAANDAGFHDGTTLPSGTIIQTQGNVVSAVATGTTTIPRDDSIPQNTEGDQYLSQSITPRSASNKLTIQVTAHISNSGSSQSMVAALFQDSTAAALAAMNITLQGGTVPDEITFTHIMTAGTTSATTFKVRIGANGASTTTLNGASGARLLGGTMASSIIIFESTP